MKKFIWLVISIINAAASVLYICRLPDGEYPLHFGPDFTTPDRYGNKWELMLVAFVPVLLSLIFIIYRAATKNNENIQKNAKYENIVIPTIIVIFMLLVWFFLMQISGKFDIDGFIPTIVSSLLGLMMIIMSNYMGKTKQNRFFGIRTRATLNNDTVWRKTHRLCGRLGMIGGLLMIIAGIVCMFIEGVLSSVVLFVCLLAAICLFGVVPSIYASKLYKELGSDKGVEAQ